MKIITLLTIFILLYTIVFSQQKEIYRNYDYKYQKVTIDPISQKAYKGKYSFTRHCTYLWLHQPSAISLFTNSGDLTDTYGVEMFPDTTMIRDEDYYGNVRFHSIAVSTDPKSIIFDPYDKYEINTYTNFCLDSMMFGYLYSRNTDTSIVDTLVVQFQSNFFAWTLKHSDYSWVYDIYGAIEMIIPAILHDELTWEATSTDANVIATYKFELREADTTEGLHAKYLYKSLNHLGFRESEIIKASFTFVPGYKWTPNVDSTDIYNQFSFVSQGNGSLGEYPIYMDDYNSNAFMSTQAYRDSLDTYTPSYFFIEKPHYLQYHEVAFLLGVGHWDPDIPDNIYISSDEEFARLYQNQPNPFKGVTTIKYSLTKAANVNIYIYNVAGKEVMRINEGLKTIGNYSVVTDASNLPAGIYYYKLEADNICKTRKMIIL